MDKKELDFILEQGEGQFIEFKESLDKSAAKEIVAFANAQGGRIFLGITDTGKIKGISLSNRLKSQIYDTAKNCDPSIKVDIDYFENIFIIQIAEGDDKPYSCSHGFYLRIGPNTQKLSRDEIIDFSIAQGKIRFDEQINDSFNFTIDFDEEKLDQYLKMAGLTKNLPLQDILINLKVAKMANNELKLNNAGVLFFAKKPEQFFFTSNVVCVEYRTNEKVDILDRKIFDDGIMQNIIQAENYVLKHIDVEFEIKSLRRKEIPQYPKPAYREAIVNAIMHRDYFQKSGDVLVEVFKNKIIVSNPGGLVKWLKEKDFGKYSRPRNQLIASLLSKTEYVEKIGTGINRIRNAMRHAGLPQPIFEYNHTFATILFDKEKGKNLEKDLEKDLETLPLHQKKILKAIQEDHTITQQTLSKIVGITEKNIRNNISKLKQKGLLQRVGPDKGGHWEITKK